VQGTQSRLGEADFILFAHHRPEIRRRHLAGAGTTGLIGVSSIAMTRGRRTESSCASKIGSISDTAAGISFVTQARLTLMPASCSAGDTTAGD
jgi:hypothetical protein